MTRVSTELVPLVETVSHDRWWELRLNRVAKRNALDDAMLTELGAGLQAAHAGGAVVAVLSANGPTFCAGADTTTPNSPRDVDKFTRPLLDTPVFVVCQVEAPVLGIGLALLACSPLVVAGSTVWGSMPEASRGGYPGAVAPYLDAVGPPRAALAAAVSAERLSAATLAAMGLVTEVVEPSTVAERVGQWVTRLTGSGELAPQASRIWRERFTTDSFAASKARCISDLVRRFDEGQRGTSELPYERQLSTGRRGAP